MTATEPANLFVHLSRTMPAPPAEVYRAFTDAAQMRLWLPAPPWTIEDVRADARVGGQFGWVAVAPDGTRHATIGRYEELRPGERIVMTWVYEGPNSANRDETLVTIELIAAGADATELSLRHERLTAGDRDAYEQGWPGVLDGVARFLA